VTLDRDLDRINLTYAPNNEEGHQRLIAKLKGMLKEIRCHDHLIPLNAYIPARIPLAGVATPETGRCASDTTRRRRCSTRSAGGTRGRQSLRGRRQLLRLELGGEPGPHHHGERDARRGDHLRARLG
jgi:hypothetical protein